MRNVLFRAGVMGWSRSIQAMCNPLWVTPWFYNQSSMLWHSEGVEVSLLSKSGLHFIPSLALFSSYQSPVSSRIDSFRFWSMNRSLDHLLKKFQPLLYKTFRGFVICDFFSDSTDLLSHLVNSRVTVYVTLSPTQ